MSKDLVIVWAGRRRRDRWEVLVSDYRKRLGRFLRVHDRPVKVSTTGSVAERQRAETRRLLEAIPDGSWSIALDRSGESPDSVELAAKMGSLLDEWQHPICFLIGSDVGHSIELLEQCRGVLSLGRLTLPHELARLVLYEQLYRSLTIRAGINYHR